MKMYLNFWEILKMIKLHLKCIMGNMMINIIYWLIVHFMIAMV